MSKDLVLLYAFEGFIEPLMEELAFHKVKVEHQDERFFVVLGSVPQFAWAQWTGKGAITHEISSISDGAKFLRAKGKRWACLSSADYRRSRLIQEQVCRDETKSIEYLGTLANTEWGAWGLLGKNSLIAAPKTSSPFPRGEILFKESSEPPSRAYLKLWEAITVHGVHLKGNERVIDLGSSPGGWTWVLANAAGSVVSVDKAALAPKIAGMKNVEYIKKDAFKLVPSDVGQIDWVFSDIICEPTRLLELVERWREAGVERFVCSIKYKGKTDFTTTEKFLKIPGSRLIHMAANKHEVTWIAHP